jgi:hypothetical protein
MTACDRCWTHLARSYSSPAPSTCRPVERDASTRVSVGRGSFGGLDVESGPRKSPGVAGVEWITGHDYGGCGHTGRRDRSVKASSPSSLLAVEDFIAGLVRNAERTAHIAHAFALQKPGDKPQSIGGSDIIFQLELQKYRSVCASSTSRFEMNRH